MKDEVEEFLRRVAQMRAQAEQQGKGQQPRQERQQPARQPRKPPAARPAPQPRPARSLASLPTTPVDVEIVDAELAETADRFGQRIQSDLRETEQIAEHSRHLGEEVDGADSKMQTHLHKVFDHQLGQLKSSSVETALVTGDRTAAELLLEQIRRMLCSPQSIRDAIIMSEILRRPGF
jgi:hypothetical protein